jgi:hypothetical protein
MLLRDLLAFLRLLAKSSPMESRQDGLKLEDLPSRGRLSPGDLLEWASLQANQPLLDRSGLIGKLDPRTGAVADYAMPNPDAKDPQTLIFDRQGIFASAAQAPSGAREGVAAAAPRQWRGALRAPGALDARFDAQWAPQAAVR